MFTEVKHSSNGASAPFHERPELTLPRAAARLGSIQATTYRLLDELAELDEQLGRLLAFTDRRIAMDRARERRRPPRRRNRNGRNGGAA
jgi:hypothetical protein